MDQFLESLLTQDSEFEKSIDRGNGHIYDGSIPIHVDPSAVFSSFPVHEQPETFKTLAQCYETTKIPNPN
jgi:hypothetical protein